MVTKNISNGEISRCGIMVCSVCEKKIGNEDDYILTFHRECSENKDNHSKDTWKDFDKYNEYLRLENEKDKNLEKAKELLDNNYEYVELVLKTHKSKNYENNRSN